MKQLDLFPVARKPAQADPRWVALSANIPAHVRLGCSSWTFRGWTGLVYKHGYSSEQGFMRESLYEYARFPIFGSVGIDRSFYNPLTTDELAHYAQLLPPGFRCVSKVWRDLATYVFPKFPGMGDKAGKPNPDFLNPHLFKTLIAEPNLAAFRDHAGPFVIEVPPFSGPVEAPRFERAVDAFLRAAPKELQYAFELREPSLLTERYFTILREHKAAHCYNQWAWMPNIAEQLKLSHGTDGMGPEIVARLMLAPATDYEELKEAYAPYDRLIEPQPAMRRHVLDLAELCAANGQTLYVIINNKAEGSAPWSAIALAELFALAPAPKARSK